MRKNYQSKNVFLTFDDGPNKNYTLPILDDLKHYGVKASFFVCGKNVERYPEVAKRIIEEGHLVGNHTYSHSFIRALTGFWLDEIKKTNQIIKNTTGVEPVFFRPPWGWLRPWLKRHLEQTGLKTILWNVAAHDHRRPRAEVITKRILSQAEERSIILLHDGCETHYRCNRLETAKALPLIIKGLKRRSYQFETVNKFFQPFS